MTLVMYTIQKRGFEVEFRLSGRRHDRCAAMHERFGRLHGMLMRAMWNGGMQG